MLAHTSPLAALTLSMDGKLLATASERGTLVRIHSTHDGSKLQVCTPHMAVLSDHASSDTCSEPHNAALPLHLLHCFCR